MTQAGFELAKALGHVSAEDEDTLKTLCGAAEAELSRKLREGVSTADCGDAFQLAAAWLALSGLAAAGAAAGVQRFSAGDISVQENGEGAAERSAALRRQAEQLLAPYLRDESFAFRGVCG